MSISPFGWKLGSIGSGPSAARIHSREAFVKSKVRQLKIPLDLMPVQIKDHTIHPAVLAVLQSTDTSNLPSHSADVLKTSQRIIMTSNKTEPIRLADLSSFGTAKIDNKCAKCSRSICCNSINQKIPTPKSKEDFDHLLWQISHDNINVFKDCDGWFLHIQTNCQHLQAGGMCGIYENRPWICREYNNDYCEFDESIADASEHFFSNADELNNYCRKRFKKWDKRFDLYQ